MKGLVTECCLLLLWAEFLTVFRGFKALHRQVRGKKLITLPPRHPRRLDELCSAMDVACVLYPKLVLCLQRSAATTFLLRHHGHCAEMVIGAQMLPFKAHAWVEIEGTVVNDKPYVREIYQVLERC